MKKSTVNGMRTSTTRTTMTDRVNRPQRDRHPARSARIIATGISVSGLVSLVSAFNVQALRQTATTTGTSEVIDVAPAPVLAPLGQTNKSKAPSTPLPAKPATIPSSTESSVVPVIEAAASGVQAASNRVVLEVPPTPVAPPAPSATSSGSQ